MAGFQRKRYEFKEKNRDGVMSREVAFRLHFTWEDKDGVVADTHLARVGTEEDALREWKRLTGLCGVLRHLPKLALVRIEETVAHVWRGELHGQRWELVDAD